MFCGKCGKELNENGLCSVCNPEPEVEETPIKPMERFDSGENSGVKPLVSAAWYTPVAFVAPSILFGIISGILTAVVSLITSSVFYSDYTATTIVNAILGAVNTLISAALIVGAAYLFHKMAFKAVDPELKKKSGLIIFFPFVGVWVSNVLTGILVSPIHSVVIQLLSSAGEYELLSILSVVISGIAGLVVDIAVAVGLFIVTKKILTKIEENK